MRSSSDRATYLASVVLRTISGINFDVHVIGQPAKFTMSNKEQAGSSNIYEIAWAGFVTELSPPKLLLLCLQKRVIIEPRELNGVCLLFLSTRNQNQIPL